MEKVEEVKEEVKEQETMNEESKGQEEMTQEPEEREEDKVIEISEKELKSLKDALEIREKEIAEYKDRLLRLAAEMENLRKRLDKEKQEHVKFANENLIKQLLPVIDNLERSIEHARQSQSVEGLIEGVEMTLKGFIEVLEQFGCKIIEAEGETFDPMYHEAIQKQESEEVPENKVICQFQKGYIMNDRLLRPAKVVVSSGKAEKKAEGENDEESQN